MALTDDLIARLRYALAAGSAAAVTELQDALTTLSALTAGSITQAMDTPASRDGTIAKVVANANVIGGIPVIHRIAVADATGDTDVVLTHKTRVIDFWFQNTGIAAHATNDTIQLKNVGNAISAALAKTATIEATVRATTMVAARVEIAAGAIMRISAVKDTNAAVTAFVLGIRVA